MNIRTRFSISAVGYGMRLTDALSPEAELTLESASPIPGGAVEIVYEIS